MSIVISYIRCNYVPCVECPITFRCVSLLSRGVLGVGRVTALHFGVDITFIICGLYSGGELSAICVRRFLGGVRRRSFGSGLFYILGRRNVGRGGFFSDAVAGVIVSRLRGFCDVLSERRSDSGMRGRPDSWLLLSR